MKKHNRRILLKNVVRIKENSIQLEIKKKTFNINMYLFFYFIFLDKSSVHSIRSYKSYSWKAAFIYSTRGAWDCFILLNKP